MAHFKHRFEKLYVNGGRLNHTKCRRKYTQNYFLQGTNIIEVAGSVSLILDVLCLIFKIATFLVATLLYRRSMRADVLRLVDKTSLITPHCF